LILALPLSLPLQRNLKLALALPLPLPLKLGLGGGGVWVAATVVVGECSSREGQQGRQYCYGQDLGFHDILHGRKRVSKCQSGGLALLGARYQFPGRLYLYKLRANCIFVNEINYHGASTVFVEGAVPMDIVNILNRQFRMLDHK
jgi:hypothetical protein